MGRRADEPTLAEDLNLRELPFPVRAELRGLSMKLAEEVGGHLLMAGQLVDTDPETAYQHADAAKRRAARLPIVREALGETAYAAGHYDVALNEMRALRRMTGNVAYLPVMADCERALGRPQAALKVAREAANAGLDPDSQAEMVMVEAGARDDLEQGAEARRLLKSAIARLRPSVATATLGRLEFAYAALLAAAGEDGAEGWFAKALEHDPELADPTDEDYDLELAEDDGEDDGE